MFHWKKTAVIVSAVALLSMVLVSVMPVVSACNTSNIYVGKDNKDYILVYGPDGNNGDTTLYRTYSKTTDIERGGTVTLQFRITIQPGCGSTYECMFKTDYKPDGWTVRILDNTSGVGKAIGTDIDGLIMGSVDSPKDGFSGSVTYTCDVIVTAAEDAILGTDPANYIRIEVYSEDTACNDEDHIFVKCPFRVVVPHDPPEIQLTKPGEGQKLVESAQIEWVATDTETAAGDLKIDLQCKPDRTGAKWSDIAKNLANTGTYDWNCGDLTDGDYFIKVSVKDDGVPQKTRSASVSVLMDNHDPPVVEIVTPSHEKSEVFNKEMTVRWNAEDDEDPTDSLSISIFYSQDHTSEWFEIASGEDNDGVYVWDISEMEDYSDYKIRVEAVDPAGLMGYDVTRAKHTINNLDGPVITNLYPPGGQIFSDDMTIYWTATDADGDSLIVTLEMSDDAGGTWFVIANNLQNDIQWSYTVNTLLYEDGDQYMVRVTVTDGILSSSRTSDTTFTIFNNDIPKVHLITPRDGITIAGEYEITWESEDQEDAVEDMKVNLYYKKRLSSWWELEKGIDNTGSYMWDTTQQKDDRYSIKIELIDTSNAVVEDFAYDFNIYNPDRPLLDVEYPDDDDQVFGDVPIRWVAIDPDEDTILISIFYSVDEENWIPIDENLPNTGIYDWDSNDVEDGIYYLKVVASDGNTKDMEYYISDVEVLNYRNFDPSIVIDRPKEGGLVEGIIQILWTAEDANEEDILTADIAYTADGTNYNPIAENLANVGHYSWDTTALPNGQYIIRIIVRDDQGGETVMTTGAFTVTNIIHEGPNQGDNVAPEREAMSPAVPVLLVIFIILLIAVIVVGVLLVTKKSRTAKSIEDRRVIENLNSGVHAGPQLPRSSRPELPPAFSTPPEGGSTSSDTGLDDLFR
ncbi:MAG: hypothetical protein ACMUIG_05475 [Thermoplasmatota archaeon]